MNWKIGSRPLRIGVCCWAATLFGGSWVSAEDLYPVKAVSLQEADSSANDAPSPSGGVSDLPQLPPVTVTAPPEGSPNEDRRYIAPISQTEVTTPTATSIEQRKFGGTVRVITREEIERANAFTIGDLLAREPGVDVASGGGPGGVRSIFLRGGNSQHTKVMIDGSPINDPSSPSRGFDAANLTLDNVEQIEILQGPQSLLYGSEAIGGVINIITRRGEGPLSGSVSAQGGAYRTHREGGWIQGGNDLLDYSFSGSWLDTQSFSAAASGDEIDPFEVGALAGAFGLQLTDSTEFVYRLRYTDARARIDDAALSLGSPPTDDPNRINLSKNLVQRFELRNEQFDGNVNHLLAYDLIEYDRSDRDDVFPSDFDGTTRQFTYMGTAVLWPGHTVSLGAQHWDEEATTEYPPSAPTNASQHQTGVFVQDQLTLWERLHLTAGIRWDDQHGGPIRYVPHNCCIRFTGDRHTNSCQSWHRLSSAVAVGESSAPIRKSRPTARAEPRVGVWI